MPRHPVPTAGPAARVAVVLTAAVLALLGAGAPAARAHDELVATVPAADATVPVPPAQVELELGAPAQALGTRVVVTGPDGAVVSQGAVVVRGRTVVQPLATGPAGGVHTVAWRVTSADGHPVSGAFSFTVAGAPAAAGGPPDAGRAVAAPVPPPPAPSPGTGPLVAGAAGVVVAAAGLLLLRSRRRA
ncbi:hypothetical protein SAMN06893096_10268 [Geodermatophilus pulveris]|uniref:CopC domain-containing protein n=1 Tax=Geodermatophilus pulveris TaxID=1564159 RepID=A0A239BV48_9ACTN|nr:copper resistance CopC family protein [Geodermatophilus pulveris]SNS11301.1 hypothetical protein SAMN06893096_10268 [Geodermatophilus pulveris]